MTNQSFLPDFAKGTLYEYKGIVTQLAATSEVATIGFSFTVPAGCRVEILHGTLLVGDIAAGKNCRVFTFDTSGGVIMERIEKSLDNQFISMIPGVIDAATGTEAANMHGINMPCILGGGEQLRVDCNATLDATKTLTWTMKYRSLSRKIAAAAIGAGISISSEVHKAI